MALVIQLHDDGEGMGLPGFLEHRALSITGLRRTALIYGHVQIRYAQ